MPKFAETIAKSKGIASSTTNVFFIDFTFFHFHFFLLLPGFAGSPAHHDEE
jgi:hypothetical protein